MAGTTRIQISTLQQLTSSDLNANQQLAGRLTAEGYRYLLQTAGSEAQGTVANEAQHDAVIGGMAISTDGENILVSEGLLAQQDWGISPAPTPRESTYLVGRLAATATVPVAVPGADSWHIIQARVTETSVATDTRNVWDAGANAFVAQVLSTEVTVGVEFNVKVLAGTELPIPDGGWVPIAGCFRDSASTPMTQADLIDLRPLPGETFGKMDAGAEQFTRREVQSAQTDSLGGFQSTTVAFSCDVVAGGRHLFFVPDAGLVQKDITAAPFGGAPTADAWHYFYVCPWAFGTTPRGAYADYKSQGVVVVSAVPPSFQGARRNSASLTLPSPFANHTVPAGDAVAFGAIRRDPGDTFWEPMQMQSTGWARTDFAARDLGPAATPLAWPVGFWPLNAVAMDVEFNLSGSTGSGNWQVRSTNGPGDPVNYGRTYNLLNLEIDDQKNVPLTLDTLLEVNWTAGVNGSVAVTGMYF